MLVNPLWGTVLIFHETACRGGMLPLRRTPNPGLSLIRALITSNRMTGYGSVSFVSLFSANNLYITLTRSPSRLGITQLVSDGTRESGCVGRLDSRLIWKHSHKPTDDWK